MKFSYGVSFPQGLKYEMHNFQMELDSTDFVELHDCSAEQCARFLQGELLRLALIFQIASGYLTTDSPEFQERFRLATELKGSVKATPKKLKSVGA